MDIMKIGAELLAGKMGSGIQSGLLQKALGGLLGQTSGGGLNIASLVGKFQGGGGDLGDIVGSWVGSGENKEISEQQVEGVFGADKIKETAESLGTDSNTLLSGLKNALPQMVDQSTPGGNIADAAGGISGALDMAKNLLGK